MRTLEITLNRLQVIENGSLEKRKEAYLSASLFFPRSGVPQVISTRKLPPLTDQFVLDMGQPNPASGRPFSWAERTLFKEEVVGKAYFVFHVKTGRGPAEKALEAAVRGLFGVAAGAIASPYVGVLASSALDLALPKDEDDMLVVAAGELEIEAADFDQPKQLTVPLIAPVAVSVEGAAVEGGKVVKKKFEIVKEGQENGQLEITIGPS